MFMKRRAPETELCHFYGGSAALAINVLYVVFWAFVMNYENQELIWLHFHKFRSFNDIINSQWNGLVGDKSVRPAIPCRVCFWPATRERLPTPGLGHSELNINGHYNQIYQCGASKESESVVGISVRNSEKVGVGHFTSDSATLIIWALCRILRKLHCFESCLTQQPDFSCCVTDSFHASRHKAYHNNFRLRFL